MFWQKINPLFPNVNFKADPKAKTHKLYFETLSKLSIIICSTIEAVTYSKR